MSLCYPGIDCILCVLSESPRFLGVSHRHISGKTVSICPAKFKFRKQKVESEFKFELKYEEAKI